MPFSCLRIILKGSNQLCLVARWNVTWKGTNKVEGRRRDSWQRPTTCSSCQKKDDKKKMRVVAMTQGNNPYLFWLVEERWQERGQNKFRVVVKTHGDNPQLFFCCQEKMTRKIWGLLPWLKVTTLIFLVVPEEMWQERLQTSWGLSPWLMATTLNFFLS